MGDILIDWGIESLKDVENSLAEIEGRSKQIAAKAAADAAKRELELVKAAAPVDIGNLRRGLVLITERNKPKAKQVYQVVPTDKMNSIFQRPVKNPGVNAGGKRRRKIAYYPSSQEFGFAKSNGGFVPGKHYMQGTLRKNSAALQLKMELSIMDSLDKEWK